jgi:hypothetical protein
LIPERREKTLEERLAAMKFDRSVVDREILIQAILDSGSTRLRQLLGDQIKAIGLSPDGWTHGDRPAGLIVQNPNAESSRARIRLAVNAPPRDYPIQVFIDDGDSVQTVLFEKKGVRKVDLQPVPPLSRRLLIVWSDKAWSPGGKDPRMLGVRLLAPR